jgi:hypothetical protein
MRSHDAPGLPDRPTKRHQLRQQIARHILRRAGRKFRPRGQDRDASLSQVEEFVWLFAPLEEGEDRSGRVGCRRFGKKQGGDIGDGAAGAGGDEADGAGCHALGQ